MVVSGEATSSDWPGKRLGLPANGPRSVARLGRRIGAIFIDWGICYLIAFAFFPHDADGTPNGYLICGVFAVEQIVFLLILNGSVGHLILGMRVVPLVPGYLGFWRPIVRTILLCAVIPAFIFDKDQRGLHDKVAGTVLVRR